MEDLLGSIGRFAVPPSRANANLPIEPNKSSIYNKIPLGVEPNEPNEPKEPKPSPNFPEPGGQHQDLRSRPPGRHAARDKTLIPRVKGGSGGTRADQRVRPTNAAKSQYFGKGLRELA